MISKITEKAAPLSGSKFVPQISYAIFLGAWLVLGIIAYALVGHRDFEFTLTIFVWSLLGASWFSVLRWKWLAVLMAPILTLLMTLALTYAYTVHSYWLAARALEEFLLPSNEGVAATSFSANMELWEAVMKDSSQSYAIEYYDHFVGAHEWIIRFSNGYAYFLSFQRKSFDHWSVSIEVVD